MEKKNTELLPIKIIKENIYHPSELYFSELISSNVYIGEDIKKKNLFMIKIPSEKINDDLITEMTLINYLPSNKILHSINIYKKNNEDSYLIFNYCGGIRLNDYIKYSQPNFMIRINLLKQFSECIIDLYNNDIKLFNLNSDFCFILDFENPILKILFNVQGLINSQKENDSKNKKNDSIQEKEDEFFWLARFIYIISTENSKNYIDEQKNTFDYFINISPEVTRNNLKKIINNIFFRCKGNEEYIKNYHIQNYIDDLNSLLNKLNISEINKEIIKNDLREQFITKVIEHAIEEQTLNPQPEIANEEKINTNILISFNTKKKTKKKSLKKKENELSQDKSSLIENNIPNNKQNQPQILNFDNYQNNQFQNQNFTFNQNNIQCFPQNYSYENSFPGNSSYMMDLDNNNLIYQNNSNNKNYNLKTLEQCITQMIYSFKQLDGEINSQIKQMKKDLKINEFKTYEDYLKFIQNKN